MRLKITTLAALLLTSMFAGSVEAADWGKFWTKFHLIKQRNDAWPQPFLLQDQQTYHAMFAPMIQTGWEVECTLGPHHFTGGELNAAGKTKLASIVRYVPESRRQVLLMEQINSELAEKRMDSVQNQLSAWNSPMSVGTTKVGPSPQTGPFVEATYSTFKESMPAPSLGAAQAGGVDGG